ncbi:MAG: cache domain-containing protein [Gammaproteobacteria bacterium]
MLAYFNQRATRQALIDAAHRALYASATQTAQAVDGFLNENLNGLRVHGLLPAVQDFLSAPVDELHKAAAWQTLLRLSHKDTVNLISFAVLDLNGHNLLDTRTIQIGRDESERDYYKALVATKVPTVSAMQFADAPGDALTLHFASLIWDPAGQPLGVLRITYNATVVQQLTTQALHASPSARVVLLDEHHIRLADSARPDLIFISVGPIETDLIRRLRAEWRLPENRAAMATGPPALEAALERLSNRHRGVLKPELVLEHCGRGLATNKRRENAQNYNTASARHGVHLPSGVCGENGGRKRTLRKPELQQHHLSHE